MGMSTAAFGLEHRLRLESRRWKRTEKNKKRERERGEQGGEEKTQFVLPAEQAWAMKPIWQSLMLKHASKPKGKALQDA